jgi:hypothetical protein
MQLLANMFSSRQATAQAQQMAFQSLLRIENPNFNSPNTIDCASCHVAEVARVLNGAALGLSANGNPNAFVAPATIPFVDLTVTAPVVPGPLSLDFHAFSYKGNQTRINQRVINETANVVDYSNTQLLTPENAITSP